MPSVGEILQGEEGPGDQRAAWEGMPGNAQSLDA